MGGWFETIGVILTVILGAFAGRAFSRLNSKNWTWGYFLPMSLVALLLISTFLTVRAFIPAFAWITGSRARFVIIGLAVSMGAMTLFGRLKNPVEKVFVFAVMFCVVLWASVLPFLVPALIQDDIAALQTKLDANFVCVQSTDYTCGPAAAVTALYQLGLNAQEGEIATLSHTSPVVGTLPWCLYRAIKNRYEPEGLECQFRRFDTISQLRDADVTLAVVKDAFLLDHCVAVLDVDDHTVTIADPVLGRLLMSYEDFQTVWRFYGITLKYNPS